MLAIRGHVPQIRSLTLCWRPRSLRFRSYICHAFGHLADVVFSRYIYWGKQFFLIHIHKAGTSTVANAKLNKGFFWIASMRS